MMGQPFVDLLTADDAFIRTLLELAQSIKSDPSQYAQSLKGRLLYALYQKTSTRTHVSFAKAADLLGCAYVDQSWQSSNFSISDQSCETKYVSVVADFFMARLLRYEDLVAIAASATIPVINGCCSRFHPMQALADALTIREHFGAIGGQRFLYIGVDNNMLNSLSTLLPRLGVVVVAFAPERNDSAFDERVVAQRQSDERFISVATPTRDALRDEIRKADVVYLDTWVDMENFHHPERNTENAARVARMRPFALTADLYQGSHAAIMHCMPVHPGYEIDREMIEHPSSIIFTQAANRTYAQAAALLMGRRN